MATEIVIPNVGESVTEGVIATWLKGEGEFVQRDETVLELETDKITMEVPAPASGVLHHAAGEGDTVAVGAVVGSVDETAQAPAIPQADAKKQEPAPTVVAATPAQKASTPVPPPSERASGNSSQLPVADMGDVRATPLAQKMAEEFGIDLRLVTPTGAGHRVREQDVLAFLQSPQANTNDAPTGQAGSTGPTRTATRERMSPLRQRIAQRLVEAQHTAAMLTTFNEIDMTAVMAVRKRYKESFAERHGIGLGFMSFFITAAVRALQAYPDVNSFLVQGEDGKTAIERHDYCDISIAVSSPKGLVVPVLRNCETMSFADIEKQIKDYALRARDGKLSLDEMTGGTFTITNGGIFGSLNSTPILNPPQSGILGMHAIKKRPIEDPDRSGEIALRPMMYVALSYDHRMVDGAGAVSFLKHLKDAIEDPSRMLLDL